MQSQNLSYCMIATLAGCVGQILLVGLGATTQEVGTETSCVFQFTLKLHHLRVIERLGGGAKLRGLFARRKFADWQLKEVTSPSVTPRFSFGAVDE